MTREENTFRVFLDFLNVKVNKNRFLDELRYHPDFPGFTSVSDILTRLNIENVTLKTSVEELGNYPKPQLIQLNQNGLVYGIVTSVNNGLVEYWLNKQIITEAAGDFSEKWNNIVLLAESGPNSGEINYKKNKKTQFIQNLRLPLIVTISLFIIIFQLVTNKQADKITYYPYVISIVTKAFGTIVSILLLYKTFFPSSGGMLDRICSLGKNVKCSGVLESKGAKIFDWLSWSETGWFYFSGGFLALLFCGNDLSLITLLAVLATISVLYVFYSIFYQLFIVKQWCTLCLVVQAIFITESIVLFGYLKYLPESLSVISLLNISVYFVIPILFWLLIKPYILKSTGAVKYKKQLLSFKRDQDIFLLKLSQQTVYSSVEGIALPLYRDTGINNQLVFISNPYCAPCAYIFDKLDELKHYFENKLNLWIIYAVPANMEDIRYQAAVYLASAYFANGGLKSGEINKKWYKRQVKNLDRFKTMYPVEISETGKNIIAKHTIWCSDNEINYTPALIFNGHLLPNEYDLEDLIFFIN